jgi:YD repeat-containing protein
MASRIELAFNVRQQCWMRRFSNGHVSRLGGVAMGIRANRKRALVAACALTLSMACGPAGAGANIYTYDALGRLKTVHYPSGATVTYTYDAAGNRTRLVAVAGGPNQNPVAVPDVVSANPGEQTPILPLANDTDPNNDPLEIVSVTSANATISADHRYLNYYSEDITTQEVFSYTISDFRGGTATSTITVNPGTNHSPDAVDDTATAVAGVATVFRVLDNDHDPDGDTLSIDGVSQPAHGTRSYNGTAVTYTANVGYVGTDTFQYTILDGHNGSDTATVTVTVGASNHNPVANPDTGLVGQNGSGEVYPLGNDTDPDGDTLTVTGISQGPSHGSATVIGGWRVVYGPSPNYVGPDSLKYTISDGHGGTAEGTITIDVYVPNTPPTANDDSVSTPYQTSVPISVLANDSDPDTGQTLTVTGASQGGHGSTSYSSSSVNYTPATGWAGSDTFTYTIKDSLNATASATVTVITQPAAPTVTAAGDTLTVTSFYIAESNYWMTVGCVDAKSNDTLPSGGGSITSTTQISAGYTWTDGTNVCFQGDGYMSGGGASFNYTLQATAGGSAVGTVSIVATP